MGNTYFHKALQSPTLRGMGCVFISFTTLVILILCLPFTLFPEYNRFKSSASSEPFELSGSDFTPVLFGDGGFQNSSAVIKKLDDGQAVLLKKTTFLAEKYPFVLWKANGLNPELQLMLFWRNTKTAELHNSKFHFLSDGEYIFDLAKIPEWRGTITELSIGVFGELRNSAFTFEYLIFRPFSRLMAIKAIPLQWTSSNMWKGTSINYSVGTISGDHFSPASFFGLLALLSLLVVGILGHLLFPDDSQDARLNKTKSYVVVIFICCLGMDAPRMKGRIAQIVETDFKFSGKSLSERASIASGRCIIMDKHMHKGYKEYDGGRVAIRFGFDCRYDPPLPNF